MSERFRKEILIISLCFLLASCGPSPIIKKTIAIFQNPLLNYDPNLVNERIYVTSDQIAIQNLIILIDVSRSMHEPYQGATKIMHVKKLLSAMNNTLPENALKIGIRLFSDGADVISTKTQLMYGIDSYSSYDVGEFLNSVQIDGGRNPLAAALEALNEDLSGKTGNTSIIIMTDGQYYDHQPIAAASQLKASLKDNVAFFPILIGNNPEGKHLLNNIAKIGGTGYVQRAETLALDGAMLDFLGIVMLTSPQSLQIIETPISPSSQSGSWKDWFSFLSIKSWFIPDEDRDGVRDEDDRCPGTQAYAKVDPFGCPLDSDGDGVFDHQDLCPNTPIGMKVDNVGCSPKDSDNDGVYDYLDECPNTVSGTSVDQYGCSLPDQDYDGVVDKNDRCPGTPSGARVNEHGCWALTDIMFAPGKATIRPQAFYSLNEVVSIINKNPNLKIEIQGHTDNLGERASNRSLSDLRAKAVMRYLIEKGIHPSRLRAKGYGFSRPVTDNKTPEGRSRNRRVEFMPVR